MRQRVNSFGVDWSGHALDPARDAYLDQRFKSLSIAREFLRAVAPVAKLPSCPCCGRRVKVYKRPITDAMAAALIYIYRFYWRNNWANTWLHVPSYLAAQQIPPGKKAGWHGGDYAKLCHWQLITAKTGTRPDGSPRVGFYKITDLGREFVEGTMEVPQYTYICVNELLGMALPYISITDALGTDFNYNTLMQGII